MQASSDINIVLKKENMIIEFLIKHEKKEGKANYFLGNSI